MTTTCAITEKQENVLKLNTLGTHGSHVSAPAGDVASFPHCEQRDAPDDANELAGHCEQSDAWVALKTSLDVPAGHGVLRGEPAGQ